MQKKQKRPQQKSTKLKAGSSRRENSTHGYHQMVNTEIRLIILFVAKDGEALHSQQNKTGS